MMNPNLKGASYVYKLIRLVPQQMAFLTAIISDPLLGKILIYTTPSQSDPWISL